MSLPAGQQQVLDWIESDLEGGEPRLRSMFAIFTRLTRDEGSPRTESLQPERRRLRWTWPGRGRPGPMRAVIYVPMVLGLVALFAFMAMMSAVTPRCQVAVGLHGAPRAATCQSAHLPPGHR